MRLLLIYMVWFCREMRFILVDIISFLCYNQFKKTATKGDTYMLFAGKEKQVQRVVMLPLSNIVPNKSQPRKRFDEGSIYSLAQSIKENGVIQPVCVRKNGVMYEIISGERRCRASKLAGLSEVPCIVMDVNEEQSAVLALIENIQRSDLSFFEEAIAINELITVYGLTQQEAARRLGKAQSTVANKLRLLRFTDAERNVLAGSNITERQARALIRIENTSDRIKALHEVVRRDLNLEQTESLVEDVLSGRSAARQDKKQLFNITIPKVYINSINKIVSRMKSANINCVTSTNQNENYFEYTIKIPVSVDMCK